MPAKNGKTNVNPKSKGNGKGPKLPFNKLEVTGNLGQDPAMKYTAQGRPWTRTSIAVWQGENQETLWLQVKAFTSKDGNESLPLALAECRKGRKVHLVGRLRYDKRETDDKTYEDWSIILTQLPVDVETGEAIQPAEEVETLDEVPD